MEGIILDKSASLDWTVAKSRLNALMETLSEEEKARFQELFDDDSIIILDKKDYPIIDPFSEPPPLARTFDEVRTWNPKHLTMTREVSISIDRGKAQQVEYVGPQGRGKVTFGAGEAIVSRLKVNGSWKIVARHPWPESGTDCRVNATLQTICGPDFQSKEG